MTSCSVFSHRCDIITSSFLVRESDNDPNNVSKNSMQVAHILIQGHPSHECE